jgi:hypothetical protein
MRRIVLAAMTLAIIGAPQASVLAGSDDPQVQDECGDADVMVRVGDVVVPTPDPERAAGFDIATVWFEDLYDEDERHIGVRVHLRMCGAIPEVELQASTWQVRWRVDESCSRVVGVHDVDDLDDPLAGAQRRAFLQSQCNRRGTIPGTSEGYFEWTEYLGAESYAIGGNAITWTLSPDMLPEDPERVAFVTPGATWSSPGAFARDWRQITIADSSEFQVSGPGVWDFAGGRDFVVGEEGP